MNVFLIPIGPNRYELYCEMPEEDSVSAHEGERPGMFQRFVASGRRFIATLERGQHGPGVVARGLWQRILARFGRLITEAVAEQRLLWHLRNRTAATAIYPDDLEGSSVIPIVRALVQKDFERHRFWLAIDMLLLAVSALLTLLPGPNLIAYYFAFRVIGHFLSIRGARQALMRVTWSLEPSAPLAELRRLLQEDAVARRSRVEALSSSLGLEQLPRFLDRMTAAGA
jgi:predicted nucleic acid-binding protein